jgi:hypothetical protein
MGLCTSVLGALKPNVRDLQKQLQTSLDGPLKIDSLRIDPSAQNMPSLMDIRDVVAGAAVAALDVIDVAESAVAAVKESLDLAVANAAGAAAAAANAAADYDDMPELVKASDLQNEIKELDITLNKLNRQIFEP